MTQDIEQMDHLMGATPEDRLAAIERSKEENGRRRQARALKEKAEEEQEKARKRRMADTLEFGDGESAEPEKEEPSEQADQNEPDSPDDNADVNKTGPDGHIDLKV